MRLVQYRETEHICSPVPGWNVARGLRRQPAIASTHAHSYANIITYALCQLTHAMTRSVIFFSTPLVPSICVQLPSLSRRRIPRG